MAGKSPAYQHYAADCQMDTMGWPLDRKGALTTLMDYQWVNDGIPNDLGLISGILGVRGKTFTRIWEALAFKFPIAEDGKRRNARLEEERQKQEEYRELCSRAGKASAAQRAFNGRTNDRCNEATNGKSTLQSSSSTTKTTKSKTKPSVAIAPVDERKAVVREAIKKGYCWANKTQDCPWGPAEEVALTAMFIDVPKSFTAEMLVDCVRNRFLSEDVRSDPPRKWIRMILTWKAAPLDRFGKPKIQGNGNGNGKPNKATERFNSNVEAIAKGFGLGNGAGNGPHDSQLAELQRVAGNGGSLEGRVAQDQRPIRVLDASGDGDAVHSGAKRISSDSGDDS